MTKQSRKRNGNRPCKYARLRACRAPRIAPPVASIESRRLGYMRICERCGIGSPASEWLLGCPECVAFDSRQLSLPEVKR